MSDIFALEKLINAKTPIILFPEREEDLKLVHEIIESNTVTVVDSLKQQIEDLKKIPQISDVFEEKRCDVWIFFPWKNTILHSLNQKWFLQVKSSRNLFILSPEEQQRYYDLKVGIAGLSVGATIASLLALENGGKYFCIADKDSLNLSNLNRINTSVLNLGKNKVDICSEVLFEINPFLEINTFESGITKENVNSFFCDTKLNLVIEETDDLEIKYLLRKYAKRYSVPLMMLTSIDSKLLVDFEDYRDSTTKPFHGKLSQSKLEDLSSGNLKKKSEGAIQILGLEHFSEKVKYTFGQLGKKVNAFPQLASGAYLRAAATSLFVRSIFAYNFKIPSGRYTLDLQKMIDN
ncbi:MAG: ThiF family adenylyltransferase [Patescibacteria group bacterium]